MKKRKDSKVMMKTLRKISAISLVGTLASGVLAGALTFDAWKKSLPTEAADYKIVVGADAKTADVIGAVEIAHALQYVYKEPVTVSDAEVVFEKSGTTIEGAVPLYKDTNKITYEESIYGGGGITSLTDVLVFKGGSIKDEDGNEYLYSVRFIPGSEDNTKDKVIFGDKPDTTDKDYGIYIDATGSNFAPLYKIKVTFTPNLPSGTDATKIKAKEITLLGKKFYFEDVESNKIVLREAAKEVTLNVGDNTEFEDHTIKLVDIVKQNDQYYVLIDVDGVKDTINANGGSAEVNGVDIYVRGAWVSETQQGVGYAEIIIGGKKVTIDSSVGYVKVGDQDLKNVRVLSAGPSGFELAIYKDYDDSSKNYLEAGQELVDPLFGTFKLVFAPVDLKKDKAESDVYLNGDKATVIIPTLHGELRLNDIFTVPSDGNVELSDDWKLAYNDTAYDFTSTTTGIITIDPSGANSAKLVKIYDYSGASAVSKYFIVTYPDSKETYVYKITSVSYSEPEAGKWKAEIIIRDEITGKDIPVIVGPTSSNPATVTVNLGGRDFTLRVEADTASDKVLYIGLQDVKFDNNLVIFDKYENKYELTSSAVNLYEAEDDGYTGSDATVQLSESSGDSNTDLELTVNFGGTYGRVDLENNKVVGLTDYGTFIEADETEKSGYVKIYAPKEQVWYDVKLAPTEAKEVTETVTKKVGEEIDGYKIKNIAIGGEELSVPKPLPFVGVLDTEVTDAMNKLIVVGGPAVNRIAAKFLGVPYPTYGAALKEQGILNENEGIIKIVEEGGKVAVLVFGWEAADTTAAAKALARYIAEGAEADKFANRTEVKVVRSETAVEGYEVVAE